MSKATLELSNGNKALCNADPISAKSSKFFSSHSTLAPKSNTMFISILFGHKAANAGLLIFSIIFIFSFDITNNAPVLPADIMTLEFFSLTSLIACHILVFFFFAATNGVSLFSTISSQFIISKKSFLIENFEISFSIIFDFPNILKKTFLLRFKNSEIPAITLFGELSPPIASTAIITGLVIYKYYSLGSNTCRPL